MLRTTKASKITRKAGMSTKLDKILHSYKTDAPFKVPDGYFAQFHEDVMARLPEKLETSVAKRVTLWEKAKPFLYIAAMFMGIYLSFNLLTNNERLPSMNVAQEVEQQPTNGQWASVQVTEQEFFQFIEDQLSEFRFREMINHLQN